MTIPNNGENSLPQGLGIDPTLSDAQPATIASLSPEQLDVLKMQMSGEDASVWNCPVLLEQGVTLESQVNANYSYLNDRGISLSAYTEVLDAVVQLTVDGKQTISRSDGKVEVFERGAFRQMEHNPLTGKDQTHIETTITVEGEGKPETYEDELLETQVGFSDIERDMAEVGIFGKKDGTFPKAGCHAEEVLRRIEATETGAKLVEDILSKRRASGEEPLIPLVKEQAAISEVASEPAYKEQRAKRTGSFLSRLARR